MDDKKFNCYKCKYRGDLPGSAHSLCRHPLLKEEHSDPLLDVLAILGSVGQMPPIIAGAEKLKIKGNPHGISHGWFNWPFNFDPTWLENCEGFESKEVKDG